MTDDQLFWEGRRTTPAVPRVDRAVILIFKPTTRTARYAVLAAGAAVDAIGYQVNGPLVTVWVRADAVVAMLRVLSVDARPIRVSCPPTTNLQPEEVDRIREIAGDDAILEL